MWRRLGDHPRPSVSSTKIFVSSRFILEWNRFEEERVRLKRGEWTRRGWGWNERLAESVAQLFSFFFFFCIASRFNEAFLNFSSACRSIEREREGGGRGRETRSIPHQRRNSWILSFGQSAMRALNEGAFPLADTRSRHDLLKFKIFWRFKGRVIGTWELTVTCESWCDWRWN